ncbi:hypothetical protein CAPTEDRAFT_223619 [Capitella teleta]|uniref:Delphilin n=1 Tax=Capitella teleta TaxID=283909 RepID=R7UWX2_CAPTE|nr:hypothetical protein CAPTEDRAFT_223619 [Capitella teleta]|eukprot:ELU10762.1 hypothetical protein CAPTEDRAFT_223619 [Capitella teleta]
MDWPECCGFSIAGDGPTYVIWVEKDSVAYSAGVCLGDQLIELDGHNVREMSSESIATLARHCKSNPPTLGVVARLQQVELTATRKWSFGLVLRGSRPPQVDAVDPPGPAYQAGIRPDDMVLQLNGQRIFSSEKTNAILASRTGKVVLGVVPVEHREEPFDPKAASRGSRVRKARDFFAKMSIILGSDYEKKMSVVSLLKQYAESRDVISFAQAINHLLTKMPHRNLVREIRSPGSSTISSLPSGRESPSSYVITGTAGKEEIARFTALPTPVPFARPTKTKAKSPTRKKKNRSFFRIRKRRNDSISPEPPRAGDNFQRPIVLPNFVTQPNVSHRSESAYNLVDLKIDKQPQMESHRGTIGGRPGVIISPAPNLLLQRATSEPDLTLHPAPSSPSLSPNNQNLSHSASSLYFGGQLDLVDIPLDHHRSFVPSKHRSQFDSILKPQFGSSHGGSIPVLNGSFKANSASLAPRSVTVNRINGSFGFVLRGHNPVSLESVVPGGPADRAGLRPGDCILKLNGMDVRKCSHTHLVRLLHGSGNSPTILATQLLDENGDSAMTSDTSSASSSHDDYSTDWLSENNVLMAGQSQSFKQKVDHLLTSKEKTALRRALTEYNNKRNIAQLVDDASQVLDTPSKKSLWTDMLPRMSADHQNYVLQYVQMSKKQLHETREALGRSGSSQGGTSSTPRWNSARHTASSSSSSSLGLFDKANPADSHSMGSFRQQLDYLLTSRERSQLKRALQIYAERRTIQHLLEDLVEILDTPSKRTLWFYIIPLLSPHHQRFCQRTLGLPEHVVKTGSLKPSGLTFNGAFRPIVPQGKKTMATPRAGDVLYHQETLASEVPKGKHTVNTSTTTNGIRTRTKMVRESSAQTTPQQTPMHHRSQASSTDEPNSVSSRNSADYRTIVKVYGDQQPKDADIMTVYSDRPPGSVLSPIAEQDGVNSLRDSLQLANDEHFYSQIRSAANRHAGGRPGILINQRPMMSDNESEARTDISFSDSFHAKALNAIKALDDVVAGENANMSHDGAAQLSPLPPPPPPPPAPPLPPPPPITSKEVGMSVKRINWEKFDKVQENTVWAKIGDIEELDDIVRYLELEQQFSTKQTKVADSFKDRKSEEYIISPKKAYNISILLGHMKMPVADIKQALLTMDDTKLAPEMLKQILAYIPDTNELEKYDIYSGQPEDLNKPDQFMYEMSRIPGFDQRLKALLFRSNFAEKVEEVKDNLRCIRKAAQELQQSHKLAKVLEIVLAMGNYMNKGNTRVGQAAGFRISFLAQLELTKTSDGKASFLHVLAEAVSTKFPECVHLTDELPTVAEAAKVCKMVPSTSYGIPFRPVSDALIAQELGELRKVLQEISSTVNKLGSQKQRAGTNDRFHEVMGHFISSASDEIQSLFSLQANTSTQMQQVIQYFGEDPKRINSSEFFAVFAEFLTKFEKAHLYNVTHKRSFAKEFTNKVQLNVHPPPEDFHKK